MIDIVYRYDPASHRPSPLPATAADAKRRLEDGNHRFADLLASATDVGDIEPHIILFDLSDVVAGRPEGGAVKQAPFAAVLGCSDARVPIELVFGQAFNDLFVVRVAGNVLGSECLGSLDYALSNLGESIKLVVVLGHSRCGAVTAAVDSYLDTRQYLATAPSHPVRAVVDKVFVAVRTAERAIAEAWGPDAAGRPGYRVALIETAVGLNVALTAATVRQEFREQFGPHRHVVYGVYDLATRRVGVPLEGADGSSFAPGLESAPADLDGLLHLG